MSLQSLNWTPSKSGQLVGRSPTHVADVWKLGEVYRWAVMSVDSKNASGMGSKPTQQEAIEAANEVALKVSDHVI